MTRTSIILSSVSIIIAILLPAPREAVAGAGRGAAGQQQGPVGWWRKLSDRSEDCCYPSYGCTSTDVCGSGTSMYGYTGCGTGQYETGRSTCPGCHSSTKCSACADCPAGRHKAAGCSRGGVAACCSADLWDGSACQWTTASCPADYWCPGDGTIHGPCTSVSKSSTGLTGQSTEAGACAWPDGRSEACCANGGTLCSDSDCRSGESYHGNTGCGAGQYETGRSQCCSDWTSGQCSTCADCPAGRHKAAGCSRGGVAACMCDTGFYCPDPDSTADGIPCPEGEGSEPGQEFCCPADVWDGSACQWTTASCAAGYWCPGDGSIHGPCAADGTGDRTVSSDSCQFDDGEVFNGTACVSTTCTCDELWNGTTCDALSSAWNEQGCCET